MLPRPHIFLAGTLYRQSYDFIPIGDSITGEAKLDRLVELVTSQPPHCKDILNGPWRQLSGKLKRPPSDSSRYLGERRQWSPPFSVARLNEAMRWIRLRERIKRSQEKRKWGTKPSVEKTIPAARGDRRPRPHCSGIAGCICAEPQCGAWDPHTSAADRATRATRAQHPAAQRSPRGWEARSGPALSAGLAERRHRGASSSGQRGRGGHRGAGAGAAARGWRGPVPTRPRSPHPSVRSSRSQRCWPSVCQPRGNGVG
ncbi:uncharacterized protein LOC120886697 [Ictidomys tridecemlineatus]